MASSIWQPVDDDGRVFTPSEIAQATVGDQFREQCSRLFCEKEEDMLVEVVNISVNGKGIDSPMLEGSVDCGRG